MLAIEKVVLIVIFVIVLFITVYLLVGVGKGGADQLLLQHELRLCCSKYRAYNCTTAPSTIECNDNNLNDLMIKLSITLVQLKTTCDCP